MAAKLSKQCHRYNNIREAFSKFYRRHSRLIDKCNIGLKVTVLQQGMSDPVYYGDLVYTIKRIVVKPDFRYRLK